MRRKLRDFVHFPLEGLDLSRIMAGDDSCSGKLDAKNSDERQGISHNNSNDETEATENGSEGSSCMNEDDGRQEMLYDLYGVVHHQGALSGGHYVASLKSDLDGQWRLFNDAQVYEIHSRDVVDASAYILFYIRRDVKDLNLSDFWDINNQEGSGLTEEEMDNLIHGRSDRCVVS
jgi:ubiquitin carboxyl-terminal hydrolase 4/11/15